MRRVCTHRKFLMLDIVQTPHILVPMAKSRTPRAKTRAPRERLTQEQWQQAIADELRAIMARKKIMQKDIMGVLGVHDPSYVSRRMNGIMPMSVPELVVLCDYLDEDITVVMSRAKENATNLCLSHSDAKVTAHMQAHPPPAAVPSVSRIA
jgi:predicted XRE-type DNA-binding protein